MGSLPNVTKDNGPAWASKYGVAGVCFTSADAQTAVAVTDAPPDGFYLVIDDIIGGTDTDMSLSFIEETSTTLILKVFLAAKSSFQITPRGKIKLPVAAKKLLVDASAAGNISVTCCYHFESDPN